MKFETFILIASPKLSNGPFFPYSPIYGKRNNGSSDTIHVIAWNCESKEEMKPLMEKLIAECEQQLQNSELPLSEEQIVNLNRNIEAMNLYIQLMKTEKPMPENLKEHILNKIRREIGNEYAKDLTNDKFMCLSSAEI